MDLKQQHNTPISQGRRQRLPFLYFLKALTFFNISQRLPAKKCRVQARIRAQCAKGTRCKTPHKSENQNQNRRIFSQKGLVPVCFCEKMCTIHAKNRLHRAHTPQPAFLWILSNSQQRRRFPLPLFRQFLSVRSRFVLFPATHTAPPARYEFRPAAVGVPAACPPALSLVPAVPDVRTS